MKLKRTIANFLVSSSSQSMWDTVIVWGWRILDRNVDWRITCLVCASEDKYGGSKGHELEGEKNRDKETREKKHPPKGLLFYFSFSFLLLAAITTRKLKHREVSQYTHKEHGFFSCQFFPSKTSQLINSMSWPNDFRVKTNHISFINIQSLSINI